VAGEDGAALAVEVTGEAPHAGKHLERCEVGIGERPAPTSDEPVDLVFHQLPSPARHRKVIALDARRPSDLLAAQ
jgi:hypothetical protein